MWCLPATQFCCGCSLGFGVKLILVFHFLSNLYEVAKTAAMLSGTPAFGAGPSFNSLPYQVAAAAFCLAGLPLILLGMWGAFRRVESLLRVYLYYEIISVLIIVWLCLQETVLSSPCDHMPTVLQAQGSAAACGIMRGANSTAAVMFTGLEIYLVFIVWSYCEDLAEAGADIADLSKDIFGKPLSQRTLEKRRMESDSMTAMFGVEGSPDVRMGDNFVTRTLNFLCCGAFADPYATSAYNSGLEPTNPLFGYTYHEMQYPPPSRAMKGV
eukprot:TRINITY_DN54022_c0_g1_i1.p1 TRINITY_DN54022_c0_g1~~TRINITY_DN54022_c0_g1_i1.p1  ORF type:complete len:269 (-),score=59.59 TRINITY_DN54022_c0_g1_i1:81-887(-)